MIAAQERRSEGIPGGLASPWDPPPVTRQRPPRSASLNDRGSGRANAMIRVPPPSVPRRLANGLRDHRTTPHGHGRAMNARDRRRHHPDCATNAGGPGGRGPRLRLCSSHFSPQGSPALFAEPRYHRRIRALLPTRRGASNPLGSTDRCACPALSSILRYDITSANCALAMKRIVGFGVRRCLSDRRPNG